MAENALTASRESSLLTLLRGTDDWEAKKAALVDFTFKPVNFSDGLLDTMPPVSAPDSWDEFMDAAASGLVTREQVAEVRAARYKGDAPTKDAGKGKAVKVEPEDRDER